MNTNRLHRTIGFGISPTLRSLLVAVTLSGCHSSGERADAGSTAPDEASSPPPQPAGSGINGTWLGGIAYGDASAPIMFTILEDAGAVSGQQVLFDPISQSEVPAGPIAGQRNGTQAQWRTFGGGLAVAGAFDGSAFAGAAILGVADGGSLDCTISLALLDGGTP